MPKFKDGVVVSTGTDTLLLYGSRWATALKNVLQHEEREREEERREREEERRERGREGGCCCQASSIVSKKPSNFFFWMNGIPILSNHLC